MTEPRINDDVLYVHGAALPGEQPQIRGARVTRVRDDGTVNLAVFHHNEITFVHASPYDETGEVYGTWHWQPEQASRFRTWDAARQRLDDGSDDR